MKAMTPRESQMYDLGRQARRADFAAETCNLSTEDPSRAFWLAGWHDEDMESGVRVYVGPERHREAA